MHLAGLGILNGLRLPGRPANDCPLNARSLTKTKVKAALILRAEAASARYFLQLDLAAPE
jgi:hypothetical protein